MKSNFKFLLLVAGIIALSAFKANDDIHYDMQIGSTNYKYGSAISKEELTKAREFVYTNASGKKVFQLKEFQWVFWNEKEVWKGEVKPASTPSDLMRFKDILAKMEPGNKLYFDEVKNLPTGTDLPKQ